MSVANAGFERTWRTARNLNNLFPFAFARFQPGPSLSLALQNVSGATVEGRQDGDSENLSQASGRELRWTEAQRSVRCHRQREVSEACAGDGTLRRLAGERPPGLGKRHELLSGMSRSRARPARGGSPRVRHTMRAGIRANQKLRKCRK